MENLFYKFEIGDGKQVQLDRLNPEEVFNFLFKLKNIEKLQEPAQFVKNNLLKNALVDNKEYDPVDLEVFEYIDLIGGAVEHQLGLVKLGKSKILKKMGLDLEKVKTQLFGKMNDFIQTDSENSEEAS